MKKKEIEDYIDYSGKLNEHETYLRTLDALEPRVEYIELVIIDQKKTNHLVSRFEQDIIHMRKVSEWWLTKTSAINCLYRIKSSHELYAYLRKMETFCKYYISTSRGDYCEYTHFGLDDIAFYDKRGVSLLETCTHEGYIMVHKTIDNVLIMEH